MFIEILIWWFCFQSSKAGAGASTKSKKGGGKFFKLKGAKEGEVKFCARACKLCVSHCPELMVVLVVVVVVVVVAGVVVVVVVVVFVVALVLVVGVVFVVVARCCYYC